MLKSFNSFLMELALLQKQLLDATLRILWHYPIEKNFKIAWTLFSGVLKYTKRNSSYEMAMILKIRLIHILTFCCIGNSATRDRYKNGMLYFNTTIYASIYLHFKTIEQVSLLLTKFLFLQISFVFVKWFWSRFFTVSRYIWPINIYKREGLRYYTIIHDWL